MSLSVADSCDRARGRSELRIQAAVQQFLSLPFAVATCAQSTKAHPGVFCADSIRRSKAQGLALLLSSGALASSAFLARDLNDTTLLQVQVLFNGSRVSPPSDLGDLDLCLLYDAAMLGNFVYFQVTLPGVCTIHGNARGTRVPF